MPRATHSRRPLRWLPLVALAVALSATPGATAQPISFDPEDPAPTLIPFRAEPKLGQVGRVEGVVDENGKRFYLDGLDVMSPLAIKVFAKDESKPLDVSLHRFFWREPNLEGTTDAAGDWGWAGRVHDEVGIELTAATPSEFYILAWQGPAIEVPMADAVFRSAPPGEGPTAAGPSSGGLPSLGMVAALAGLAIVAALAFVVLRKRAAAAAGIALLLWALPEAAHADDFAARLQNAEAAVEDLQQYSEEVDTRINDIVETYNENFDKAKGEIDELYEDLSRSLERVVQVYDENFAKAKAEIRGLESFVQQLSVDVAGDIGALQAAVQSLQLLAEEDRRAIPDPTHGGVPPIASYCFGNADCAACFRDTHAKMREQLDLYSQLRVIYQTTDAYLIAMIGLGDSSSGWHQLEQAAWYAQKQKIVASHEQLKTAYRNKLDEFNRKLWDTLKEYGTCESTYGLDDWFNRYGEPFYHSLTASYRLP